MVHTSSITFLSSSLSKGTFITYKIDLSQKYPLTKTSSKISFRSKRPMRIFLETVIPYWNNILRS